MLKIKVAVYSDNNPLNDYIDILEIPDNISVEVALNEINSVLLGYHLEFISYADQSKNTQS